MLMKTDPAQSTKPLVWVLQTARAGDSAQARALADAVVEEAVGVSKQVRVFAGFPLPPPLRRVLLTAVCVATG